MEKLKQGDFVRLENSDIPRHIELLRVSGYKIWENQNIKSKHNCIKFSTDGDFLSTNIHNMDDSCVELSKHDWVCAVIGLHLGVGMSSETSTFEQRRHVSEELEKLGVKQSVTCENRSNSSYIAPYRYSLSSWCQCSDLAITTNVLYSDFCKKLGIEPVYAEEPTSVKNACVENIITLPDGSTVDLSKPIEVMCTDNNEWGTPYDSLVEVTPKGFAIVLDDGDLFVYKGVRNKPEPEFNIGEPVWGLGDLNVWLYGYFTETNDGSFVINYQSAYNLIVPKIKPAINPDGTPNFPPFKD